MTEESLHNYQFERMADPARKRLQIYSIEELCRKGKLDYDTEKSVFRISSIGKDWEIRYPEFTITPEPEMWHYLTLLQYMDIADGTPLSGQLISLQQMQGGLSRGRGYEHHIDTMFVQELKNITAKQFCAACEKLGARILPSRADVSARIDYAPMFPITVNFWEADEEYPASVKTLVDASADHYLGIEAAGGACLTVMQEIHHILFPDTWLELLP